MAEWFSLICAALKVRILKLNLGSAEPQRHFHLSCKMIQVICVRYSFPDMSSYALISFTLSPLKPLAFFKRVHCHFHVFKKNPQSVGLIYGILNQLFIQFVIFILFSMCSG